MSQISVNSSGLGIRPELFDEVAARRPNLDFFEAHSENYFGAPPSRTQLLALREDYPVSLHGVGLSLGRADDLDQRHLTQLKQLADDVEPLFVSEHLSWSAYSHRHVPDLLPLPLTQEALAVVCEHIDRFQTVLGRQILIENPSNYLLFEGAQIDEPSFLNEVARQSGCGLLLDVNNVYVSATNLGRDPQDYINALDSSHIQQYHLAGYHKVETSNVTTDGATNAELLVDTHNQPVHAPVWALFEQTIKTHGVRPTLLEWDSDFPEFDVLMRECAQIDKVLSAPKSLVVTSPVESDIQNKQSGLQTEPKDNLQKLADLQTSFLNDIFSRAPTSESVSPAYGARIHVYQNNVFAALQNFLGEVFPATKGVVGDAYFKQLAQRFIDESPPEHGNLHDYGQVFSAFVGELPGLEKLPYLEQVAEYEWAIHSAYYAPASQALLPHDYAEHALLMLPVAFDYSVRLLKVDYPITEIHRQSLPGYQGKVFVDLNTGGQNLLVCRYEARVRTFELEDTAFELHQKIDQTGSLLTAIESLADSEVEQGLSNYVAELFERRILTEQTTAHALH